MNQTIDFRGMTAQQLIDLAGAVYALKNHGLGGAVLIEFFSSGKSQWRDGNTLYFYDNGRIIQTVLLKEECHQ